MRRPRRNTPQSEPRRPLVKVTYAPEPQAHEQLVALLADLLDKRAA